MVRTTQRRPLVLNAAGFKALLRRLAAAEDAEGAVRAAPAADRPTRVLYVAEGPSSLAGPTGAPAGSGDVAGIAPA